MICFYHSMDLDGICSGAVVKTAYPHCKMIGYDYGQPFPWHAITVKELVYMVDVSLSPMDMKMLATVAELVWIDHHKSAIEQVHALGLSIDGIRDVGFSGCELAWAFLHALPIDKAPRAVRMLGRYDVWDHAYSPDVMPFQYGMRALNLNPESWQWKPLLLGDDRDLYTEIVCQGAGIVAYEKGVSASIAHQYAFEQDVAGLRCIVLNRPAGNSQMFASVYDPSRHDAMCAFAWHEGMWRVSLYADKPEIDVSQIARTFGGGGHKSAAGWKSAELPWNKTAVGTAGPFSGQTFPRADGSPSES